MEAGSPPATRTRVGAGINAAAAMTMQNASTRPTISGPPTPIESWNTRIPPLIAIRFVATAVNAITARAGPI